jgi:hypothetical protein
MQTNDNDLPFVHNSILTLLNNKQTKINKNCVQINIVVWAFLKGGIGGRSDINFGLRGSNWKVLVRNSRDLIFLCGKEIEKKMKKKHQKQFQNSKTGSNRALPAPCEA